MAGEQVTDVVGQLFGGLASGAVVFIIGIIIAIAVVVLLWYFFIYKRKFDIIVKVKSDRAEDKQNIIFDKGAFLDDRKTDTKYFRIWGLKRDFPVPRYNVLQSTNKGDLLELYRKGDEEFYFLLPSVINKVEILRADGKKYPFATHEQTMIDPDVAFWNLKRKSLNKKMFSVESLFMKLLPFLPQIIGSVIMIFVLFILLDHLPGILSELRNLAQTLNEQKRADVVVSGIWNSLVH